MQLPDEISGSADDGCGEKSAAGEKTNLADADKAKPIVSCCRTSAFKEKHMGDLATRVPLIVDTACLINATKLFTREMGDRSLASGSVEPTARRELGAWSAEQSRGYWLIVISYWFSDF